MAINIFWIICGAGFIYYPGILMSILASSSAGENRHRSKSKFALMRGINPKLLFVIAYPLAYIFSVKMSNDALNDRLIIEAYMWMIPLLIFTVFFLLRMRIKRRA